MRVLRRTWLATTLFVVTSSAIWWKLLDLEAAREHFLPTLFLTPIVWWLAIGRNSRPGLPHGTVVGAVIGVLTQLIPDLPMIVQLFSHPGTGDGEDQAIAMASAAVYLMIGLCAGILGAAIGLLATAIQRRASTNVTSAPARGVPETGQERDQTRDRARLSGS